MNISCRIRCIVFSMCVLSCLSVPVALADQTESSTVNLDQSLYFKSPSGDPVHVHAGQYVVELKEDWLQLRPVSGERVDAVLVETQVHTHEQDISNTKVVLSSKVNPSPDIQQLILYLPDGIVYEAMGSQSGVWPRGIFGQVKNKIYRESSIANRWLKSCAKNHPTLSPQACCTKQQRVCRQRCPKGRVGNTCKPGCTKVHRLCVRKAAARERRSIKEAQETYQSCRRIRNVVDHNVCCFDRFASCGTTCKSIGDKQLQDSCYQQCSTNRDSCFQAHSKRDYAKLAKKKPNSGWMKTYCSHSKNLKNRTPNQCCTNMVSRCLASCEGYPKGKINACTQRCDTSHTQCVQDILSP